MLQTGPPNMDESLKRVRMRVARLVLIIGSTTSHKFHHPLLRFFRASSTFASLPSKSA